MAIDPYQASIGFKGLATVKRAHLEGYLEHIDAPSDRALPPLLERRQRYGLAYIDASHLFEDIFLDCHYVTQLLSPGGVMVLDDSTNAHVHKVVQFIRSNMRSMLQEIDLSPYRPDGGKSLKYRLACQLGLTQLTGFRKVGEGRRNWSSRFVPF